MNKPYWSCQAAGWFLYAAGVAIPYVMKGAAAGPLVLYSSALSLLGIVQTHVFRGYAKKHGWERLDALRLVPRILASSTVMGVVMNAFMVLCSIYHFKQLTWPTVQLTWLIVSWVWWFFPVFVGWEVIYFAVQFVRRARHAEVAKWQLKSEFQTAELRFLRAQLNPHFLFNALNSVRGLIAEDPARAQAMVTRLSALLRHSLSSTLGAVPLTRELEVVSDYLELEAIRFEDRLRVTMNIDPATLTCPVPPMLVQGLAENAIKHGIALRPEGGELTICARLLGDAMLDLTVVNTAARARRSPREGGVGLANARERLRLLFGEKATLELDDTPAGSTTARVLIPRGP